MQVRAFVQRVKLAWLVHDSLSGVIVVSEVGFACGPLGSDYNHLWSAVSGFCWHDLFGNESGQLEADRESE